MPKSEGGAEPGVATVVLPDHDPVPKLSHVAAYVKQSARDELIDQRALRNSVTISLSFANESALIRDLRGGTLAPLCFPPEQRARQQSCLARMNCS